jgi:hypothetical protein
MALFVVVGLTNLAAMVVLAAVVLAEKLWVHGELLARLIGVAALALAVAVIWVPALAPGLHQTSQMMSMAGRIVRRRKPRLGSLARLPRPLEAESPSSRWLCPADCSWLSG